MTLITNSTAFRTWFYD